MSRSKLFIENILVYGLGSVINKIIPFLLLPFITKLLPNSQYYGFFDILNIIVSFSSAIVILGMYDMMFRMFFEKNSIKYKRQICSSSLFPVVILGFFILLMFVLFRDFLSSIFFKTNELSYLILIGGAAMYFSSLNVIIAAPTRMLNKKKTYIIINVVSSIVSYSLSIFMLIKGFFLLALPMGLLVSSLFSLIVYYKLNYKWFSFNSINCKLMREMLFLGLPLVPVFLFYWIFKSFDRLMISKMLGDEVLGVYAVGAKVASISQLIYVAFAAGWQYFAFSTMKDKDQVSLTSKIFEYLGILSFIAVVFIDPFTKIGFELFFEENYINGYIVVPYLFLSPLILMLFQTGGNQFLVIKKTYYFGLILLLGALLNIYFNYLLIPILGIEGASIATLLGYLISTILVSIVLLKLKLLTISFRFILSFILTIGFMIISRIYFENSSFTWVLSFIIISLMLMLYKTDLYRELKKIKK